MSLRLLWGGKGGGARIRRSICNKEQVVGASKDLLWPTLCNRMDCSMPGFPVLHYLPEFAQTRVQGWNPCALQWNHRVLTTGPPGKSKILLWIRENQTPQVNELNTFLCMGRCRSLGSVTSSLWWHLSLSATSALCFPALSLLRVHLVSSCGGCWLDSWQPVCILSSLRAHRWGAVRW